MNINIMYSHTIYELLSYELHVITPAREKMCVSIYQRSSEPLFALTLMVGMPDFQGVHFGCSQGEKRTKIITTIGMFT